MSLVTSDTTQQTKSESAFIKFSNEVARGNGTVLPFWTKNLELFERIFLKFRDHGKSSIPILKFIETNRETLEHNILEDDKINDDWLIIDSTVPLPTVKPMIPTRPRGVFLSMGDDDWKHCLPLAEIYTACIDICNSDAKTFGGGVRTDFSGVTIKTIQAKFLHLFYSMLSEVEPDNAAFIKNMEDSEELITPADTNMMGGIFGGMGDIMNNMLKSDMGKNITGQLADVAESVDDSTKNDTLNALRSGDLTSMMSNLGPMIQSPAFQGLLANVSSMVPPGMMGTPAGPEVPTGPQIDAGDQE